MYICMHKYQFNAIGIHTKSVAKGAQILEVQMSKAWRE